MIRARCRSCLLRTQGPASRRPVVTKTSTGIVGLAVDPDGRNTLISKCKEILDEVKVIPRGTYREEVEAIYGHRLKVCSEMQDEGC